MHMYYMYITIFTLIIVEIHFSSGECGDLVVDHKTRLKRSLVHTQLVLDCVCEQDTTTLHSLINSQEVVSRSGP